MVNVASRIESNTVGGQVLVGEDAFDKIHDRVTALSPLTVMMKGMKKPLVCYPVTAIGKPYDIRLKQQKADPLEEIRIPFQLWQLEEKKVVAGPFSGETRQLNASTLIVTVDHPLTALTNVKLLFTFA